VKSSGYSNILITGGAGFVGSNLAVAFQQRYPQSDITCLDNLKRRGSELNLPRLQAAGIRFVHGDIRNREDLDLNQNVDLLIECSAEPSVLAGFDNSPDYLINTNLVGTVNCLEVARRQKADMIFLSTSRVYPSAAINAITAEKYSTRYDWREGQGKPIGGWSMEGINTDFTLEGPRSMYGATKLCSELIIQEYAELYGLRVVINRCGVIAGPWQFGKVDQGVICFWLLNHYFEKPLTYIGFGGTGMQVRDILHVQDLYELLDLQLESFDKANGQIYNVGGGRGNSISLLELSERCHKLTGNKIEIHSTGTTRHHDLMVYITDNRRVHEDFGWSPQRSVSAILEDIYAWLQANEKEISNSLIP